MMEKISGPVLFLTSVVYALWAAVFLRLLVRRGGEGERYAKPDYAAILARCDCPFELHIATACKTHELTDETILAEQAAARVMADNYLYREKPALFPGTSFSRN